MLDKTFIERLEGFIAGANKLRADMLAKDFPTLAALPGYQNPLQVTEGPRYLRVVREESSSRSVYCFIDKTNGDVLKAAGWKAPAKGARSNINDADFGLSGVTQYGGRYLR